MNRGREITDRSNALARVFLDKLNMRLPIYWNKISIGHDDLGCWSHTLDRMTVILSTSEEMDGEVWLHFSIATPNRLPTWDELKRAKEAFLGDVYSYMVFPPEAKYVNIHPYCLHLFHCLTRPSVLPDFTGGLPTL